MDELAHQIKHAAQQQGDSPRPFVYAHISSYDPTLHRVRVVFPSLRDEADNPVLSSWMPLESHWVGPSWGFQVAPIGGATQQNPTQGEMVQVHFVEHRYGVTSCAKMFFNQVNQPPFTDLKPGEMGMKHKSGAFIKFTNDEQLTINSQQDVVIIAQRDATVTTQRDAVVNVTRNANVTATEQANVNTKTATVTASEAINLETPTCNLSGDLHVGGEITWPDGSINGGLINITGAIIATGDVQGGGISLIEHFHTQPADSHGDTEQPTNPPQG